MEKFFAILVFCVLVSASCGLQPREFRAENVSVNSEVKDSSDLGIKVVIEVLPDGSAALNGKTFRVPTDLSKLREAVENELAVEASRAVMVKAARNVGYENVVTVVNELKKIEGIKIGLAMEGRN